MAKILMKGNEALGEAALRAGAIQPKARWLSATCYSARHPPVSVFLPVPPAPVSA